jgi:hypothetical protein
MAFAGAAAPLPGKLPRNIFYLLENRRIVVLTAC